MSVQGSGAVCLRRAPTIDVPRFIMKPISEKVNRDNHRVRVIEHDCDPNLLNFMFADDILLISGSLQHTTMLDDLITATTLHGLQLHLHENKNHLQTRKPETKTR